jgi:hypothetical protein
MFRICQNIANEYASSIYSPVSAVYRDNCHMRQFFKKPYYAIINLLSSCPLLTWGEWAIAMHGRYESHILFILFTYICYVHIKIFVYFSTIYFIFYILYMDIVCDLK